MRPGGLYGETRWGCGAAMSKTNGGDEEDMPSEKCCLDGRPRYDAQ
jgi:hypothetical protein